MLKSLFIHVTQITDLCFQFNLSFHILLPFTLFCAVVAYNRRNENRKKSETLPPIRRKTRTKLLGISSKKFDFQQGR